MNLYPAHASITSWEDFPHLPSYKHSMIVYKVKEGGCLPFKEHGFSIWHLEIEDLISHNLLLLKCISLFLVASHVLDFIFYFNIIIYIGSYNFTMSY